LRLLLAKGDAALFYEKTRGKDVKELIFEYSVDVKSTKFNTEKN